MADEKHFHLRRRRVPLQTLCARPLFQTPLGKTILGFVLLCLISSTIYIINDIADVNADRQHPKKKYRPYLLQPVADPGRAGVAIAIGLFTLVASFALDTTFGIIIVLYRR